MSKHIFKGCIFLFCMVSCKTVNIHKELQKTTQVQQTLGSIGATNGNIISNEFYSDIRPNYTKPIAVTVSSFPFTKNTYRAFTKAQQYQAAKITLRYADTLKTKPAFVQLQLADKVTLIEALNGIENKGVKAYLSNNDTAVLVTNISVAFNKEDHEILVNANAVHLIQDNLGSYVLQCYQTDGSIKILRFHQGVVFAYKAAHSCWKENSKQQLDIVDLVAQGSDCSGKTYKSAERAKKQIDYFKF